MPMSPALLVSVFPVRLAVVLFSGVTALALAQSSAPRAGGIAPPDAPVAVTRDIAYLGPGRTERADLYLPAGHEARATIPAVLVIHGGGWAGGDKTDPREINLCTTLARHGHAAFSFNYRLGSKEHPAVAWPQNILDCRAATRWLCANAGRLGLDATRLGVIGSSAGGHLAALLGVTENGAAFAKASAPEGDVGGGIKAIVVLYAPIQLGLGPLGSDTDRATSPLTYLDPHDPPDSWRGGHCGKPGTILRICRSLGQGGDRARTCFGGWSSTLLRSPPPATRSAPARARFLRSSPPALIRENRMRVEGRARNLMKWLV